MKPWILVVAVVTSTTCGVLLMRQHFQGRAAQAEADDAMRSYNELRAQHERELAELKAQEESRLKHLADQDHAVLNHWGNRLSAAQKLYERDAQIYGKEEATRRHQAGVYLKAVSGE